ncbi:ATP-binding cassette domain-containing protein [Bifidobacterium longum]|nr:ATP-binding cassette domain-containing protein [Bifidobacterium longum]
MNVQNPAASRGIAIQAVDLVKNYGTGSNMVHALRGVNVSFERGKFTAIMGPSGSGKSTLMHTLAGLDSATSGHILFGGADLTRMDDKQLTLLRRHKIGFIYQSFNLLPMFTAEQNILMPLTLARDKPDHAWFDLLVDTLGLKQRLNHRPNELSGGQQQRVAIARALITKPKLVFADEPTGNLDSVSSAEVLSFLKRSVNDLTGLRARVDVSIHLAPMDRGESMTLVRRKNAEVKMQIMDQRRKNRKQGLDPDDLPDDLADQQEQLGQLRDELRSTNQRLVDSIIVIGVSAASQEELEVACRNVKAKVNAQSCTAESLKFMQMEGLTAELPLGNNPLPMKRTLTTNSAAILIPFTTQEVFEPHGLFYGSNARSGNPILADRRSHMNSNGFVLGTSGGGKSFTVKQEIAGMFLNRDDEVIVIDPEREYLALAAAFGGQIIQISAGTGTRVNPMDIVLEDDSASDPVKDKTNNVVSMIGALIGGIDGLDPLQKGLVDQCVSNLYTRYRNQGGGVVQPTLQDLHDELQAGGDQVSRYLADALNPYITGSMSGFNGQTNVDLSNRFTVFDVSGLSGELRTFGMMVVIDQVWNRVIRNKANGRRTWLYVDEFHRFFSNQYAAAQFKDIYKRARKYGLGVTGITQNVEEILDLQDAREMLSNSDFLMLLSQNSTDADALCELLTLSEEQRQYFTGVLPGQGLMKIGSAYVPFDGRIPAGGDLYRLYSTTFQEGK